MLILKPHPFNNGKQQVFLPGKIGRRDIKLGELDGQYFLAKRKPEHIFKKIDGLGVNAELIDNPKFNFKIVRIELEVNFRVEIYETTREHIRAAGTLHAFSGYEQQYFLERKYFNFASAKKYKDEQERRASEINLFAEAV